MSDRANLQAFLQAGELDAALAQIQDAVRTHPRDVAARVSLVELLAVVGDWSRALKQLGVLAELDKTALAMAHGYGALVRAEQFRAQVFEGERTPLMLGEPEPWLGYLVEALAARGRGDAAETERLRTLAFEQADGNAGEVDGEPFAWVADANPRLGPTLELVIDGKYYWVPVARIERIQLDAPEDLRDLVWLPVHLTWRNQGESHGFAPVRYPGSERSTDPGIRLARRTDWTGEGDLSVPLGQRMLVTDTSELALLDVRELRFDAGGLGAGAAEAAGG